MKKQCGNILSALAVNLLLCTEFPSVTAYAADGFVTNADGTVSYYVQDVLQTGKFSIEPDYLVGDVEGNDDVTSTDAAILLTAAAAAGVGSQSSEDYLLAHNPLFMNTEDVLRHADVNADAMIDASDAAIVLNYAAAVGANAQVNPLGFAYYYADENGILQTGSITDTDGSVYYALEDYKLCTGWLTTNGSTYYYNMDGQMLRGWQTIDSCRYYFNANGIMYTGLHAMADGTHYFDDNGVMRTGWQSIDGKTHYFNENGIMLYGWQTIGGKRYHFNASGIMYTGFVTMTGGTHYFGTDGEMRTGWQTIDGRMYYFNEDGIMQTGWQTIDGNRYHFNASGIMYTGFVKMADGTYYFGTDGIMRTGTQIIDGQTCNFGEDGKLRQGWTVIDGKTYYYDDNGNFWTGWMETDEGDQYYFDANGVMATGFQNLFYGMCYFEPDGKYVGMCYDITEENTAILENAERNPHNSYVIYNRQVTPEVEYMKVTISEKDIEILEAFADEHFTEDMTMAQRLWITQMWIHLKVDYAYVGEKWNEIVNLSYVDAIFNHRKGQCVQYNGAMAAMMVYYGYDVYMVKGWTSPGTQHFWTVVVIDDVTYMMECGNYGKNGSWRYFLDPIEE